MQVVVGATLGITAAFFLGLGVLVCTWALSYELSDRQFATMYLLYPLFSITGIALCLRWEL